jgi:hypothetical protein
MRNTNLSGPRRVLVAAALVAVAVAGCSNSSSGGEAAAQQTTGADQSETFHNITPAVNASVQRALPLMRGVAMVTYQDRDLVVRFTPDAEKLDQTNVENVVHQAVAKAEAKASKPKQK